MKEKIIRHVAKIISKQGYEAASTRAICESVGITAPTLYYYFKTKPDLFDAVTTYTYDLHRDHKLKSRTEDSFNNLKVYWDFFIQFAKDEPELHKVMVISLSQGRIQNSGTSCFKDLVKEFMLLEKENKLNKSASDCSQIYLAAALGLSLVSLNQQTNQKLIKLSEFTRDMTLSHLIKIDSDQSLNLLNKKNQKVLNL